MGLVLALAPAATLALPMHVAFAGPPVRTSPPPDRDGPPVRTPPRGPKTLTEVTRVAVVDVQRCIMETAQGQKAKKDLESAMARTNAKLERKAKELQKQVDDLQAKAAMLSNQELERRQMELVQKDSELQQLYQKAQAEVADKEAVLTEKIYKNVQAVVKQLAVEDDIQVVFVRADSNVLYANPKLDLTNRVIVAYDQKFK